VVVRELLREKSALGQRLLNLPGLAAPSSNGSLKIFQEIFKKASDGLRVSRIIARGRRLAFAAATFSRYSPPVS